MSHRNEAENTLIVKKGYYELHVDEATFQRAVYAHLEEIAANGISFQKERGSENHSVYRVQAPNIDAVNWLRDRYSDHATSLTYDNRAKKWKEAS